MSLNKNISTVRAFAPATTSNLSVGFDVLGLPVSFMGDEVTLSKRADNAIVIQSIISQATISKDIDKNTATIALQAMLKSLQLNIGFDVEIKKGIPVCSGLGGSAASAVAAVVACNAFLDKPLDKKQLAAYALEGESFVSGGKHLDNIAPCLWGELTLIRDSRQIDVITLPIPALYIVLVHPDFEIPTVKARQALSHDVSLSNHIGQSANLAALVASLYLKDTALLKRAMVDNIIEPQRAHLLPGFYEIKEKAIEQGALACSFSGAGPTLFAITDNKEKASVIARELVLKFKSLGLQSQSWFEKMGASASKAIEVIA
jgi:homoserine kinase